MLDPKDLPLRRLFASIQPRRIFLPDHREDEKQPLLPATASGSTIKASSGFTGWLSSLTGIELCAQKPSAIPSTSPPPESGPHLDPDLDSDHTQDPNDIIASEHCASCRLARSSPGYSERVAKLMDPLYCAGCRSEHPALLFSHSSRKTEPRVCISHQGSFTVCPHLRFSVADIQAWRARGKDMRLQCEDAMCPCPGAVVEYSHFKHVPVGYISVTWEAALDKNCHHGAWDRYMAKVRPIQRFSPASFCPSFQATPNRLFQQEEFERSVFNPEELSCVCVCGFILSYGAGESNQVIRGLRIMHLRDDGRYLMPEGSIKMIDPDSYGHFTDPDTEHITWCRDQSCATTRELLRFYAMIYLGGLYDGDFFRGGSDIGLEDLDENTAFYAYEM